MGWGARRELVGRVLVWIGAYMMGAAFDAALMRCFPDYRDRWLWSIILIACVGLLPERLLVAATIVVTGAPGTTIPQGTVFQDGHGNVFVSWHSVTIGSRLQRLAMGVDSQATVKLRAKVFAPEES